MYGFGNVGFGVYTHTVTSHIGNILGLHHAFAHTHHIIICFEKCTYIYMICVNALTQPHTWTHQMSMRDVGIQPVAIALMPRSKYKHVTWHSRATNDGKPWQATVQRKYLGSFAQEAEAAKAVAKFLRQPMANLLTSYSAPKETHQRTHRYVYWRWSRLTLARKIGGKVWGSFVDHADALAVAVKKAGLNNTTVATTSEGCA